jgi:Tfp pilus assembly protein PilF
VGHLHSQRGAHDLAIADFTEAIRLDPENPHGYVLRAKEYRAVGDDARAASDERKVETMRKQAGGKTRASRF